MTSKCPVCGSENDALSRYCTNCGSPLPSASPPDIREEITLLKAWLAGMQERLNQLEKTIPQAEAKPEAEARVEEPLPPVPPVEPPKPQPEPETPVPEPVPTPRYRRPATERPPRAPREWEQILGGSWLARIGVLALIIGAGFFLKYAFDNDWIGPELRVIIGVIAGMFMIWVGYHWRNRYPIMTQVLSGGGIAIQYLALFAAFAFYDFLHFYVAVFLLFVVSAGSALLSLRYRSRALAVLGTLGAFFAPFLLGGFHNYGSDAATTGRAMQLLGYIVVVDIGVIFLSRFRNWRWLSLLALAGTVATYLVWYNEFERHINVPVAEIGLTVIFLIFAGVSVYHHVVRRVVVKLYDDIFFLLNGVVYFGISFWLLWDEYDGWMGLFSLLLAIVFGLLYRAMRPVPESVRISAYSLFLGLISLTVAVPVQFRDTLWTPVTWSIEIILLLMISGTLKLPLLRYFSYLVIVVLSWRMILFDMRLPENIDFVPVLNERFPAVIAGIAAIYCCLYLIQIRRTTIPEWRLLVTITAILANFFTIWLISVEVWDTFGRAIRDATDNASRAGLRDGQTLSLTAVWALYAAIALTVGIWRRWKPVRLAALFLLAVPIVKVFVYDVFKLDTAYRIGAFIGLGLLLLVSAYLYQRFKTAIKGALTGK